MHIGLRCIENTESNEKHIVCIVNLSYLPHFLWFSLFLAKSEVKIHKTLVFLNETPPIIGFLFALKTGRVKGRSHFWMEWSIFHDSWGISTKICIVDTYRKSKRSIVICIEPKTTNDMHPYSFCYIVLAKACQFLYSLLTVSPFFLQRSRYTF